MEQSPFFFTPTTAGPLLHSLAAATGRIVPLDFHDFYDCYYFASGAGFPTDRKFKVQISLIESEEPSP
jgi:hypothetical protein